MAETASGATYEKTKERRGYAAIPAIDPHDGGEWDVLISPQLLQQTQRRGMGRTKELADTVRWAVLHPTALFRGIRDIENEIDDDDWLCYVATPPTAYDYKTGDVRDGWSGQVLLVCVNDERVLFNWMWVDCDPENPKWPIDHKVRFREKVF